jgi:hypothetical protein
LDVIAVLDLDFDVELSVLPEEIKKERNEMMMIRLNYYGKEIRPSVIGVDSAAAASIADDDEEDNTASSDNIIDNIMKATAWTEET